MIKCERGRTDLQKVAEPWSAEPPAREHLSRVCCIGKASQEGATRVHQQVCNQDHPDISDGEPGDDPTRHAHRVLAVFPQDRWGLEEPTLFRLAGKAACKRRSGHTVTKIPEHGATLAQVIIVPVCETTDRFQQPKSYREDLACSDSDPVHRQIGGYPCCATEASCHGANC